MADKAIAQSHTEVLGYPFYICDALYKVNSKCDLIKGNESDVGNIDFKLQAKRGDKFLCFEVQRIVHISATRWPIEMGLDQNVEF